MTGVRVAVLLEFPQYLIWSHGYVFSLLKGSPKELKGRMTGSGHYKVTIKNKDGKWCHKKIHRLVAETFLENPDDLPVVNHKDTNKANNEASNLEWCTQKYNMSHAAQFKREKNIPVLLYKNDEFIGAYDSIQKCAETNNLSYTTVYRWAKGIFKSSDGYKVLTDPLTIDPNNP